MIYTDADSCMILLADIQERNEPVMYLLQLLCILFVCIFQMLEGACGIYIVSRIDTHFLDILCCYICYLWVEVDVGNQWNHISVPAQTGIDVHQVFRFFNALCCQTYIFTSGIYNTFSLCHAGFCILCGGVCHTLYAYRIGAAHRGGSNIYF